MNMQYGIRQRGKKIYAALVLTGAVAVFFVASSIISTPGWAQSIPFDPAALSSYDAGEPTMAIPFLQKGTLFLSHVRKPVEGATTVTEVSRQAVADKVYRLADVNRQTGQYLYQTLDEANKESVAGVTTWLGDAQGKVIRVYTGGGYVKLSPGGSYIAATDEQGVLRIIDVKGKERAVLEEANYAIFSPDGTKLAFLRTVPYSVGDAGGIAVINISSGKTLVTYRPDGAAYVPFAFSEDSNTLYFAAVNAVLKGGDPSNQNRVDLYALLVSEGAVPQLVTTGMQKLPYMDYSRIEYLPGPDLLVLSAEGSVWTVNTQTGNVRSFPEVTDVLQIGAGNTLFTHSSDRSVPDQIWSVLTAR